ncbi:MAG: hypothetical protein NZ739_08320, partial [Verrucomicrobiae bacterium]|nr:hypothetical protein [Verrucomicrobiae bacterium]
SCACQSADQARGRFNRFGVFTNAATPFHKRNYQKGATCWTLQLIRPRSGATQRQVCQVW